MLILKSNTNTLSTTLLTVYQLDSNTYPWSSSIVNPFHPSKKCNLRFYLRRLFLFPETPPLNLMPITLHHPPFSMRVRLKHNVICFAKTTDTYLITDVVNHQLAALTLAGNNSSQQQQRFFPTIGLDNGTCCTSTTVKTHVSALFQQ